MSVSGGSEHCYSGWEGILESHNQVNEHEMSDTTVSIWGNWLLMLTCRRIIFSSIYVCNSTYIGHLIYKLLAIKYDGVTAGMADNA